MTGTRTSPQPEQRHSGGKAPSTPHVALIIETSSSFGRRLIRGVGQYVRENGPWAVYVEPRSIFDPAPRWLTSWQGDGIICNAAQPAFAKTVLDLAIPTVDIHEQTRETELCQVFNDDRAIGHQAAEHLLRNGFTQFGFVGYRGVYWSDHRCDGFREAVESAGGICDILMSESMAASRCELRSWDRELDQMAEWLRVLPKPVGVMAATDFRAVQVLDACRQAGVAVPEQVAVIGVDDEEVVRELAHPPLSSIRTNAEQVGYRAAEMLAMLMAGNEPPVRKLFVKPLGVSARQSTDLTAIEDPVVAKALSFIRREACRGINVEDVLRHLDISRSVIQRRFRKQLGRTVHDEIIATRVGRTKELLAQTDLSLSQIAERVGIAHIEYLSAMFKRRTGLTLSAYRRSTRRALRSVHGRRGLSHGRETSHVKANR